MTKNEILGNSEVLIVAGSETTATALSGITFYLGQNPTLLHILVDEVRSTFSSEEEITMKTAAELTYLQACVEEGLRIFPPVVVTPPKLSPGDFVGGYYLPKNVSLVPYLYIPDLSNRCANRPRWLSTNMLSTTASGTGIAQTTSVLNAFCPRTIHCTTPRLRTITGSVSTRSPTARQIASARTSLMQNCV
jgi:hypothetical protein